MNSDDRHEVDRLKDELIAERLAAKFLREQVRHVGEVLDKAKREIERLETELDALRGGKTQ